MFKKINIALIICLFYSVFLTYATEVYVSVDGATFDSDKIEETDDSEGRAVELSLHGVYEDLELHYKMNDDDTSITDDSQNGFTGTADTTSTVAGKIGQALYNSGTMKVVTTEKDVTILFTKAHSFSLWLKPDDGQPASAQIFLGADEGSSDDRNYCTILDDGKIQWSYNVVNLTSKSAKTNSAVFSNGAETWHHVVLNMNTDTMLMEIWFDGAKQTLDATLDGDVSGHFIYLDGESLWSSGLDFYLFCRNYQGSENLHFVGAIDDFRLYSRALTSDEIAWLYRDGDGHEDSFATDSPVATLTQIDSASASTEYSGFKADVTNTVLFQYSANSGTPAWSGSWESDTTISTALSATATTGQYWDLKCQMVSDGTYDSSVGSIIVESAIETTTTTGGTVYISTDGASFGSTIEETDDAEGRGVYLDLYNISISDCVTYYKMDERGASTAITDTMGNHNAVLDVNADTLEFQGEVGNALSFTGSSDKLDTDYDFETEFKDEFMIMLWTRPADGQPSSVEIIMGTDEDSTDRVLLSLETDGTLNFLYRSDSNQAFAQTNSAVFANGQASWTHVALVATTAQLYIIVNGVDTALDGTNDGDMSGITMGDYTNNYDMYIGCRNNDGSEDLHYYGVIDEWRFFDVVDTSFVSALYTQGATNHSGEVYPTTSPVATLTTFDSGSDDTLYDMSTLQADVTSTVLVDYGASNTDSAVYTGTYQTIANVLDDTDTTGRYFFMKTRHDSDGTYDSSIGSIEIDATITGAGGGGDTYTIKRFPVKLRYE